jgi:crotonobetainyl-CoA:carnitine CoA-transferase CaiB-like acyl-CoA transferase
MALRHRDATGGRGRGEGQIIDVALYEAVFNMMESTVPEYDRYGVVRVHADVDGDGRKDRITWFRSQSESAIPPDSSSVTVTLSGSGKTFALEEPRVLLAHYGAGYYVVAGTPESDPGPWEIKVLRLQTNGMKRLCTFKRPQWVETKPPGGGRTG